MCFIFKVMAINVTTAYTNLLHRQPQKVLFHFRGHTIKLYLRPGIYHIKSITGQGDSTKDASPQLI